ncbi:MAG: hypothetical protein QM602_02460, partial [Microbacterium sp.]
MTMLRLDPAHPPLWRDHRTLQFGRDAVARIDDPAGWQQRLVHELEGGIPASAAEVLAVAAGGTARGARALLAQLAPALKRPAP